MLTNLGSSERQQHSDLSAARSSCGFLSCVPFVSLSGLTLVEALLLGRPRHHSIAIEGRRGTDPSLLSAEPIPNPPPGRYC